MPRLTHSDYYLRHTLLSQLWDQAAEAYSGLSYVEQQAIHRYYLPTCELDLTEFAAYRSYVTKLEPSLSQRAGRAYERLAGRMARSASNETVSHGKRTIRLRAVAEPDIDVARLARALRELAESKTR